MLKPGLKLQSAVSDVQVVVVRAPADDVTISCGGVPMVDGDAPEGATLDPSLQEGPLVGKRYADEGLGLEILCTKAGEGTLTVGDTPLPVKGAKPLPSSD